MLVALSTGHTVGLAVSGAAFIAFALASSLASPRFRRQYPGGGLLAFIVVAFVFFFGMLTAVEVFGAESGHEAHAAETGTATQQPASSAAQTISVSETE